MATASAADLSTIDTAISWANSSGMSLTDAMNYINSKWQAFQNLGPAIVKLQGTAKTVAVQAANQGRTDIQQDMQNKIAYLGTLNNMVGSAYDELDNLQSLLQQAGLDSSGYSTSNDNSSLLPSGTDTGFGQDPITLSGTALVLALGLVALMMFVTWHYNDTNTAIQTQGKVLSMVSAGAITPQQGQQMMDTMKSTAAQSSSTGFTGIFNSIQGIIVPLAIAAAAIVILPALTATRKSRG